jgi:hypothetical protein
MTFSVRSSGVIYRFPDFFAIFAALGLKLGLLLCSQEELFQFTFWCDRFILARVLPLKLRRISFPGFFGHRMETWYIVIPVRVSMVLNILPELSPLSIAPLDPFQMSVLYLPCL